MRKLTHLEFLLLPPDEQGGHIFGKGTYLASRREGAYGINLYYLNDFYCEMWLEERNPELDFFRTFPTARCLDAYLDQLVLPAESYAAARPLDKRG